MALFADVVETRRAYRAELGKALEAAAEPRFLEIEGGPEDGVAVLTRRAFEEALAEVMAGPIPRPSIHVAEVETPATIIVAAVCPRCGIPAEVVLSVHPELLVDEEGAEIRVKTKAKARSHVCDQLPAPLFVEPGFDLPDGEAISSDDLLELLETVRDEFEEADFPTLIEIDSWRESYRAKVKEWAIAVRDDPEFDGDFPELEEENTSIDAAETPDDEAIGDEEPGQ